MRLSLVFELLLIFILLAFAASRVIDSSSLDERKVARQGPPNRYCACTNLMCNCCREFSLAVVPIKGPGCATLTYLQGDSLMVTMSFGDRVLHNTTITGRKPKPVCMPLPGGISKFCGRVYGISRQGENFKACLGLELRALDDLEAALRVSCFRFGPQGLNLEPAPPVPVTEAAEDDDEDDDDDDEYGIVDDDDDDDDFGIVDDDDDDDDDDDEDEETSENDVSPDYEGFSVFGDDFLGGLFGESSKKKKKKNTNVNTPQPLLQILSLGSEKPILDPTPLPTKPATKPTVKPLRVRTTTRPVRITRTTTRRPPHKLTSTTTSTTTPKPVTKVPELLTTIPVQEEPVTSTVLTVTAIKGNEAETVLPDVSSGVNVLDDVEKSESTTTKEVETTPVMEIATEIVTSEKTDIVDDHKEEEAQEANDANDGDDDEDDDSDDDDDVDKTSEEDDEADDDDDDDDDDDEEDEEEANETETTPEYEAESSKPSEKKEEDEDEDEDELDLGLDDDDDDDEDNEDGNGKDRSSHKPLVALRRGRTHRRMRLERR